jgi:hypothetical protein
VPTAKHETICDALKAAVQAIGGGVPPVVVRAEAWYVKGEDLPIVILSMGDEHEGPQTFGGSVFREYQTLVTVIYAGRVQLEAGLSDAKGWRDAIKDAVKLDETSTPPVLPGAPEVWDVDVFEVPPQDPTDFAATYTTARLGVVCRTNEVA